MINQSINQSINQFIYWLANWQSCDVRNFDFRIKQVRDILIPQYLRCCHRRNAIARVYPGSCSMPCHNRHIILCVKFCWFRARRSARGCYFKISRGSLFFWTPLYMWISNDGKCMRFKSIAGKLSPPPPLMPHWRRLWLSDIPRI